MGRHTIDLSVLELIRSFSNGIELFNKKGKKKKLRNENRAEDDEGRLRKSLQRGPIDLQQEYNRNYTAQGDRFRHGDCETIPT
jgi:hypothetical protein